MKHKIGKILTCTFLVLAVALIVSRFFGIRIHLFRMTNIQWTVILLLAAWASNSYGKGVSEKDEGCLLMVLLIVLPAFLFASMALSPTVRTFSCPVTERTFAMEIRRPNPMRTRGYAIYYERRGIFLTNQYVTERQNAVSWGDFYSILISERGIHVNYTFMSPSGTFPHGEGGLLALLHENPIFRELSVEEKEDVENIFVGERSINVRFRNREEGIRIPRP